MRRPLAVAVLAAASVSCHAAAGPGRADEAAVPLAPKAREPSLRCGVDDEPRLATIPALRWGTRRVTVLGGEVKARGGPAPEPIVDAITEDAARLEGCASFVAPEDEGVYELRVRFAKGGGVLGVDVPAGGPASVALQCVAERACGLRGVPVDETIDVDVPVRLSVEGYAFADATTLATEGLDVGGFVAHVLEQAAREAASECAKERRPIPSTEARARIGLATHRSFATFRRETFVTDVAIDAVEHTIPTRVARCMEKRLRSVRFGDRFTPAGASTITLRVGWM